MASPRTHVNVLTPVRRIVLLFPKCCARIPDGTVLCVQRVRITEISQRALASSDGEGATRRRES
jgi:hypothetical protein